VTRRVVRLVLLAALPILYLAFLVLLPTLTGRPRADGVLGVLLGLFVCSFPARHFVDLLVYWRTERPLFSTRGSLGWWLALNAAVMVTGWVAIVVGTTRLTASR
jgi:hypothetical protein